MHTLREKGREKVIGNREEQMRRKEEKKMMKKKERERVRQYMTHLRLLWIKLNAMQLIASLC